MSVNKGSLVAQLSKFGDVRKFDLVEDKLEVEINAGKRTGPVFGVEFFGIIGSAFPDFTDVLSCNESGGVYSIVMTAPEPEKIEVKLIQTTLF